MADFIQGFWSLYIAIPTVLGLIGVFCLAWRLSSRPAAGESTGTSGHVWDEDLTEYNNPLPRWWLNMLYLTIVWGLLYLLAYPGLGTFKGLLGWSQQDAYEAEMSEADARYAPIFARYADQPIAEVAADPKARKIGERLYATYCTGCHGSDARGARGFPNLRDGDWLYGGTPEAIEASITNGRQAAMPAWGAILGVDKVAQVTAHVEQLAGRTTDSAAAAAGQAVFKTHCAACHGPEGQGNPLMGAPNLSDDIWLYGGSTKKIAESIQGGRNGHMPAHGNLLGPARAHLLAAYVYGINQAP